MKRKPKIQPSPRWSGPLKKTFATAWKTCWPFVETDRAKLTHRVKHVTTFTHGSRSHIAVRYYCGNSTTGQDGDDIRFEQAPTKGATLCQMCEAHAVLQDQKTAEQLTGKRHVCKGKGKTKVVRSCKRKGS